MLRAVPHDFFRRGLGDRCSRECNEQCGQEYSQAANHDATITHPYVFMSSFHDVVREAIYSTIVSTGAAPRARDIAELHDVPIADVEAACRALADAHVIVLHPGSHEVAWAPPFSSVPTRYKTHVAGTGWYAPCAWDAFGIAAALTQDAAVDATCAWSDERLDCGVANGRAYGNAVIHLLVPAAQFWDDIFFT